MSSTIISHLPSTADAGLKRTTYQAATLIAPRQFELRELPLPETTSGCVRVRIQYCGVCASNVPPYEGRPWFGYPFGPGALGHEAVGIIEDVASDVTGWTVGQRVAFIGERGFAEYEVVRTEALFAIPDGLESERFLAEPLACAMNVYRRSGVTPKSTVAIVGCGFLGSLLAQLAIADGARVFAIGRRPSAVEMAIRAGAEPVVSTESEATIAKIMELTDGKLCDIVIEATGYQEPLDLAAQLTRIRGRLVIAGYHQDGLRPINLQLWNWRGIDVVNAHERDTAVYLEGMQLAADAMLDGRINPAQLITHQLPLAELGAALEMTAQRPPGFLKAVITL